MYKYDFVICRHGFDQCRSFDQCKRALTDARKVLTDAKGALTDARKVLTDAKGALTGADRILMRRSGKYEQERSGLGKHRVSVQSNG